MSFIAVIVFICTCFLLYFICYWVIRLPSLSGSVRVEKNRTWTFVYLAAHAETVHRNDLRTMYSSKIIQINVGNVLKYFPRGNVGGRLNSRDFSTIDTSVSV